MEDTMAQNVDSVSGARPPTQHNALQDHLGWQVAQMLNANPERFKAWQITTPPPLKLSSDEDLVGKFMRPFLALVTPKTGGGCVVCIIGCALGFTAAAALSAPYILLFNAALGPMIKLIEQQAR
jgi:hypothetical protein